MRQGEKSDHLSGDASSPAVSVEKLSKNFGTRTILKEISFDIAQSEVLVVLGPSGSGKSTLLRILAGLEPLDSGEISMVGSVVNNLAPQQRRLGVVFQDHALFERMTVEQNIAFGLEIRKMPRSQILSRIGEMLDLIRIGDKRKKYPSQLSGGQRQRVALARALAYKPDVLLLDEPFSSLDAVIRADLRREVRTLLRSLGISALFITHDQEEALEMADRIAVINDGRIEQISTPFEIYNHPRSEFVATFLGAANVLLGRWRGGSVIIGSLKLKPPTDVPPLEDRQPIKIVFRPEDAVIGFQPQLLDVPYVLGRALIEDLSYIGHAEKLTLNLSIWDTAAETIERKGKNHISLVDEIYTQGMQIMVSRTKWEANDMELSPGDSVVVGLKDYRLLPHYPLKRETGAKVAG
jgi:sulfate transport system ATP-binding protein